MVMNRYIYFLVIFIILCGAPLKADPIFEYDQKSVDAHFVKLDVLEKLHKEQPHLSISKLLEIDIFQDVIIEKNVSFTRDPDSAIRRKSFGIGMLIGLGCVVLGYGIYYLIIYRGV
jgi:hypothetical protein